MTSVKKFWTANPFQLILFKVISFKKVWTFFNVADDQSFWYFVSGLKFSRGEFCCNFTTACTTPQTIAHVAYFASTDRSPDLHTATSGFRNFPGTKWVDFLCKKKLTFPKCKYRGFLPNATFGSGKKSHQPNFALAKYLVYAIFCHLFHYSDFLAYVFFAYLLYTAI